jgi:hypothetical protein
MENRSVPLGLLFVKVESGLVTENSISTIVGVMVVGCLRTVTRHHRDSRLDMEMPT